MQLFEAKMLAYVPAGQLTQSLSNCDPVKGLYLPTGQLTHALAAVDPELYVPAGQLTQLAPEYAEFG